VLGRQRRRAGAWGAAMRGDLREAAVACLSRYEVALLRSSAPCAMATKPLWSLRLPRRRGFDAAAASASLGLSRGGELARLASASTRGGE